MCRAPPLGLNPRCPAPFKAWKQPLPCNETTFRVSPVQISSPRSSRTFSENPPASLIPWARNFSAPDDWYAPAVHGPLVETGLSLPLPSGTELHKALPPRTGDLPSPSVTVPSSWECPWAGENPGKNRRRRGRKTPSGKCKPRRDLLHPAVLIAVVTAMQVVVRGTGTAGLTCRGPRRFA